MAVSHSSLRCTFLLCFQICVIFWVADGVIPGVHGGADVYDPPFALGAAAPWEERWRRQASF